jgi:hypothetical protein
MAPIEASSFDQHCTKNGDCEIVEVGDPCHAACGGELAAVNVSAANQVDVDFANEEQWCIPSGLSPLCADRTSARPVCDARSTCSIPSTGDQCPAAHPPRFTSEGCVGAP